MKARRLKSVAAATLGILLGIAYMGAVLGFIMGLTMILSGRL